MMRCSALSAVLLCLMGCPTTDPDGPGPGSTGGGLCPESVLECVWGEGCHDGVCGSCATADECHPYAGCRSDGTCGECADSGECRQDEACRHGQCMPASPPIWELAVDEADWEDVLDHPEEDIYIPCALSVGDVVYDEGVELRLRGGSTRSLPKKSLRIRFPEDAEHPGFSRKINLRAEYNDPSFLRTFLGLEAFRRMTPLPTPRVRYLDLYVNGDYYGLMLETERIGGKFLELRGRDRELSMYETADVDDEGALTPNDSEVEYREIYEKKTGDDADYSDVIGLIEDVLYEDYLEAQDGGVPVASRTVGAIHVEAYLRYLALMAVLQSQDHVTNNFYFSHQWVDTDQPRWEVYPADMDLTFGCRWDEANDNPLCDEFAYDGWWMNGWIPDDAEVGGEPVWGNLMIDRALRDPLLWPLYVQNVCELLAGDTWNEVLPGLIDAAGETIAASAAADPNDMSELPAEVEAAQAEVRSFLSLRREYLAGELGCP